MVKKRTVSQCTSSEYCKGWNDAVDEMPKWIDVNERLPERGVRVLVYLKESVNRYTRVDTDRVIAKKVGWVRWGDEVTHWMSLPEPPQIKE